MAAAGSLSDEPVLLASFNLMPFITYTKLDRDRILDNFLRSKIFGYLLANPGENCTSIMIHLEIPQSTIHYHIKRLEGASLVKAVPDGLAKRYYPASTMVIRPEPRALTNAQKTIYDLISGTPGLSQRDLARMLNVTSIAVNNHIKVLMEKEMVRREKTGLRYRYYPVPNDRTNEMGVDSFVTPPV